MFRIAIFFPSTSKIPAFFPQKKATEKERETERTREAAVESKVVKGGVGVRGGGLGGYRMGEIGQVLCPTAVGSVPGGWMDRWAQ